MVAIYIDSFEFSYLKEIDLGQRLRFFRQKCMQYGGESLYTTTALAERLNVTPQTISAVERGISKKPSFSLIHELTKEYYVPLEAVTDEYYEGKEQLFSIGKPQALEIDLEDDEDDFVILDRKNPTTGLLLFNCNNEDNYEILYVNHFSKPMIDSEISKLSMRLAVESSMISNDNYDPSDVIVKLSNSIKLISKLEKSTTDFEGLKKILSYNPMNTDV